MQPYTAWARLTRAYISSTTQKFRESLVRGQLSRTWIGLFRMVCNKIQECQCSDWQNEHLASHSSYDVDSTNDRLRTLEFESFDCLIFVAFTASFVALIESAYRRITYVLYYDFIVIYASGKVLGFYSRKCCPYYFGWLWMKRDWWQAVWMDEAMWHKE